LHGGVRWSFTSPERWSVHPEWYLTYLSVVALYFKRNEVIKMNLGSVVLMTLVDDSSAAWFLQCLSRLHDFSMFAWHGRD
jgi:hypothetical protein